MENAMPHLRSSRARFKAAALLALVTPLVACASSDRIVTGTVGPQDYRARHPIELAQGWNRLEVFPEAPNGVLDDRTKAQVKEFARSYRLKGSGEIRIALPYNGQSAVEARAALPGLRRALAGGGARAPVNVLAYSAADPTLAAPVRLSYSTIVALTPTQCGLWPHDLASGSSTIGWENRPYWNFGCASQQMIATQVADPRDLLGPAADAPPDSQMRGRAIDAIRQGKDPGTSWTTQNSNISGIGN
jgi:pilus assembly protein CpaD